MMMQSLFLHLAHDTRPQPIWCITSPNFLYVIQSYWSASVSFSTCLPLNSTQWRWTSWRLPAVSLSPPLSTAAAMMSYAFVASGNAASLSCGTPVFSPDESRFHSTPFLSNAAHGLAAVAKRALDGRMLKMTMRSKPPTAAYSTSSGSIVMMCVHKLLHKRPA